MGEDQYAALSLETTRDLLLTQKLIAQPYLDVDVILQDDAKYAKKQDSTAQLWVWKCVMKSARTSCRISVQVMSIRKVINTLLGSLQPIPSRAAYMR